MDVPRNVCLVVSVDKVMMLMYRFHPFQLKMSLRKRNCVPTMIPMWIVVLQRNVKVKSYLRFRNLSEKILSPFVQASSSVWLCIRQMFNLQTSIPYFTCQTCPCDVCEHNCTKCITRKIKFPKSRSGWKCTIP